MLNKVEIVHLTHGMMRDGIMQISDSEYPTGVVGLRRNTYTTLGLNGSVRFVTIRIKLIRASKNIIYSTLFLYPVRYQSKFLHIVCAGAYMCLCVLRAVTVTKKGAPYENTPVWG